MLYLDKFDKRILQPDWNIIETSYTSLDDKNPLVINFIIFLSNFL